MQFLQFLYAFAMMFLSIFGLVVLLKVLFCALLDGSRRKFEVYVRDREDIEEFLESARKSAFIERVIIITEKTDKKDKSGEELRRTKRITEKYAGFVGSTER